ncbi:hypothetical protein [Amorphus coralli]|uniref:hypothetical protein n=1 Tax=Amorphus coralli TaxID=340680 RepID=UPI00037F2ABC|nr:hypothetical protein [Amorphus coralli]
MSGTTSGVAFSASGEDVTMQVFRGKTLSFEIIWGGDSPVDLTGASAVLQARDREGALLLDLSTGNGGIAIDGPAGRLVFSAPPSDTASVSSPGVYEVELTTAAGAVHRVISGLLVPVEEVVR